jgi:hypothetical protein
VRALLIVLALSLSAQQAHAMDVADANPALLAWSREKIETQRNLNRLACQRAPAETWKLACRAAAALDDELEAATASVRPAPARPPIQADGTPAVPALPLAQPTAP